MRPPRVEVEEMLHLKGTSENPHFLKHADFPDF